MASTSENPTASASASANKAGTWQIDPAHSSVDFVVTHLMISKVRGRFSDISGTVTTDGKPEDSRIEVEVGTASISTNDAGRDTHLRSADFFDVDKHPKIKFVSTSIKAKSHNEFRVTGDVTIHGVTKSIDLDVTGEGTTRDPWGNDRAGFSAKFSIDRRDFGLTWNQALETGGVMVSNEVKLTVDVELTHKAE